MLPDIEQVLMAEVEFAGGKGTEELQAMLRYHLGWEGEGAGLKAQGKRIRPLMVLLSCAAAGGIWEDALAAAASVELLHNFSLIHDDIQDDSEQRRGRPTLWKKWGIAQAINAGDSMFSLAHNSLLGLSKISSSIYSSAIKILPMSSLKLTQGQYMDLAFENQENVTLEEYWKMVEGKTAELLSTCSKLGAISAEAEPETVAYFKNFGVKVGLAFQAHDDILGIWGNEQNTGKSNHSDLLSGKKSLPVLYGIKTDGKFAQLWNSWNFEADEVASLADALEADGAKQFAEEKVNELTEEALQALDKAIVNEEAGSALRELALELVARSF